MFCGKTKTYRPHQSGLALLFFSPNVHDKVVRISRHMVSDLTQKVFSKEQLGEPAWGLLLGRGMDGGVPWGSSSVGVYVFLWTSTKATQNLPPLQSKGKKVAKGMATVTDTLPQSSTQNPRHFALRFTLPSDLRESWVWLGTPECRT